MPEFIQNIIAFINENASQIAVYVGSAEFAAVIAVVVKLVSNIKEVKLNTSNSKKLADCLDANNVVKEEIVAASDNVKENVTAFVETSQDMVKAFKSVAEHIVDVNKEVDVKQKELEVKLNAILDILQVAYSASRSEEVRTSVATIVNSIKYEKVESNPDIDEKLKQITALVEAQNKAIAECKKLVEAKQVVKQIPEVVKEETIVER